MLCAAGCAGDVLAAPARAAHGCQAAGDAASQLGQQGKAYGRGAETENLQPCNMHCRGLLRLTHGCKQRSERRAAGGSLGTTTARR